MDLFCDIETFSLANGVRCVAMPRCGYSIELHVFIATGSMHEAALLGSGMSHFLEHMLFQGCDGFPNRSAGEKIQRHGGDINAYTTFDRTAVTAHIAPDRFAESMAILAAMVRSTEVSAARFEEERKVILRECNLYADKPWSRLFDAARALSFDRHPVRVPVIGYPELVEKLTRKNLLDYHAARYTPERCVIVAVGNIDPAQFRDAAENSFGSWRRAAMAEPVFPSVKAASGKEETFFFPDPQERIWWGMPLYGITDRRAPATDLLFGMLGGAESSFLPVKLELESGVAQTVRSFCDPISDFGYAGFYAAATPENFDKTDSALRRGIKNFLNCGLTEKALRREKKRQSGNELAEMNDFSYLAAKLGVSLLSCGRADFPDVYRRRLAETTLDEVRETAAILLDEEKFDRIRQKNFSAATPRICRKTAEETPQMTFRAGLPVVSVKKTQSPMDYATLILPGGAFFEKVAERGLSQLWSQLFLCGGNGIHETDFLKKLDDLGAAVNVNAGMNSLAIEVNAPHGTFLKTLAVVGKVLAAPDFDETQFQREKTRLIEIIELQKSSPLSAAMRRARQLCFGNHPYVGTPGRQALQKLTSDAARKFWQNRFVRSRAAVGFSGSVDPEKALELFLGNAPWCNTRLYAAPQVVFPDGVHRETLPLEREQLAVVRILPGVRLGDERTGRIFSLLRQNENGLFSRLFQEVREKNSLVYSVGMRLNGGFHRGSFAFHGLTRPDQGEKLAALLDGEIRRLARKGITRDEFALAVERQIFENGSQTEHPEAELFDFALDLYYGKPLSTAQRKNDFLRKLSLKEFNRELAVAFADAPKTEVFAGAMP